MLLSSEPGESGAAPDRVLLTGRATVSKTASERVRFLHSPPSYYYSAASAPSMISSRFEGKNVLPSDAQNSFAANSQAQAKRSNCQRQSDARCSPSILARLLYQHRFPRRRALGVKPIEPELQALPGSSVKDATSVSDG